MGEAKQKSLNRQEVLKRDPRCIYCLEPSKTWDHMPPKAMFKDKDRPSGMEYGCCEACNSETRTADAVAAFIAHSTLNDDWRAERLAELLGTIIQQEPNFRAEFFGSYREDIYASQNGGPITPAKKVRLDGPIALRHLTAFSAKLGMALFYEHTGEPMSVNSGVYVNWFGTPLDNQAERLRPMFNKLPNIGELKQGNKQSKGQFIYKYLMAEASILVAFIKFQEGLHVNIVAIKDLEELHIDLSSLAGFTLVKFGELANLVKSQQHTKL